MNTSGAKVDVGVEEIIATLKKTNLPTIVVEGKDDVVVYRRIEELYSERELDVLPVGGRDKVIAIFDRIEELPRSGKFAFIVDKDLWVLTGVPAKYQDSRLVLTDGYSIENDAYRDGQLFNLMMRREKIEFEREVHDFCRWYSDRLCKHLAGEATDYKCHPEHVFAQNWHCGLTLNSAAQAQFVVIHNDYAKMLRGKSLVGLLMRQLSRKGRNPKHNHVALLERVAAHPGPLVTRIFQAVGTAI